jgi:D-glycero-alpha-D-manno-heptose-7-phosphate kinase
MSQHGITVRAPVRVDFSGGYTDVAPYSHEHIGRSVNAAIQLFVTVVISPARGTAQEAIRHTDATAESLSRLVTCATHELSITGRPYVEVRSSVPAGSGLGTSGALSVALVNGLRLAYDSPELPPLELAETAAHVERLFGVAGGKQDQFAAAFGGVNAFAFDANVSHVTRLEHRLHPDILQDALVYHDGGTRQSSQLVERTMAAYASGDPRVRHALHRLNELAADLALVLADGSSSLLGEVLTDVRALQRELDPAIAESIDRARVMELMNEGLCWGKPLGGAGPGAAWLIVPNRAYLDVFRDRLRRLGGRWWDLHIAHRGSLAVFPSAESARAPAA